MSAYNNRIKAVTRQVVLDEYKKFAAPIFNRNEDITAYTLPADIWAMEQAMVEHALYRVKTNSQLNLTCFESNDDVYQNNTQSRYFMLDGNELHDRLNFDYKNNLMHRNLHAKKNFFMWADFCGYPTQERLDMVLHKKNLVVNSLIFVTFACRWRKCHTIPMELHGYRDALFADDLNAHGVVGHHSSDATELFMLHRMEAYGFRPTVNIEYIATKGKGGTPMCVIGFSNSPVFKNTKTLRKTLNWFKDPTSESMREILNYKNIQACVNR